MAETPTVAIQYQFKTEGLMKQFDILDYMIDIDDVDRDSLQQIVDNALSNRFSIKRHIKSNLPNIKNDSERSAKLVRENVI
jgi:colanic acid/amylovoran biosynthesis protein